MTNNLDLFSDFLKPIRRRVIKVREKKLYSNKYGLTRVQNRKRRTRLITVFYVSDLGVNLLSVKRLCEMKLKKSFDEDGFYMRDKQRRLVLRVFAFNGVYIVDKVTKGLDEIALIAAMAGDIREAPLAPPFTEVESDAELTSSNDAMPPGLETNESEAISTSKLEEYRLWHRRFAHMGKAKLKNLHKITTLKKPILIVEDPTLCRVCFTTKLTNARSRVLVTRKPFILVLIFIDICGELSPS